MCFPFVFTESDDFEFSGGEQNSMTYEDARRFKLRFGQCSGKRLGKIGSDATGRDYLRWLLQWEKLRADTKVPIEIILNEYEKRKDERNAAKAKKTEEKAKPAKPAKPVKKKHIPKKRKRVEDEPAM